MELIVRLTGAVKESNFTEYKDEMLAVIGGINTDLQTDEDFAVAEDATKTCKQAEETIADAKKAALDQTKSIRELYEAMDEVSTKLRETRLELSKKVKTRKDEIKDQLVSKASATIKEIKDGTAVHPVAISSFGVDFTRLQDAVKGKRSIESMKIAIDKDVESQLADFSKYADMVVSNAEILRPFATEYPSLFADERTLLVMAPAGLNEVIDSRIAQRKAEDEARRLKEEAKAKEEPVIEKVVEPAPPAQEPVPEPSQDASGFILTVILDCDKERAVKIAQTLDNTMAAYGKSVKSINLGRI